MAAPCFAGDDVGRSPWAGCTITAVSDLNEFRMSGGGARDWRVGWRLTSAVPGDPEFEVSLDPTRREPADGNEAPEHGVMLRNLIRWIVSSRGEAPGGVGNRG